MGNFISKNVSGPDTEPKYLTSRIDNIRYLINS